jgi:hypothetical protein
VRYLILIEASMSIDLELYRGGNSKNLPSIMSGIKILLRIKTLVKA